jgi:hypothetical protein
VESPTSKRRILEKKLRKEKEQGFKRKRGKTSFGKLHVTKRKKGMRSIGCWERFYQKKERKENTISYSVKSDV